MSEIKKYELTDDDCLLNPHKDGFLCRYSEVKKLEEENRMLRWNFQKLQDRNKELEEIQSGSGCICGVYMK